MRRALCVAGLVWLGGCAAGGQAASGQVAPSAAAGATPQATAASQPGTLPAVPAEPAISQQEFEAWLVRFREEASAAGISPRTLDRALTGIGPVPSVLAADANQPEFTRPIWSYLDSAVSQARITRGRELLRTHAALFSPVEARWGVPAEVVAAIWAIESNFGAVMGDIPIVPALATLGYSGRRTQFGRRELLAALAILDRGDITPERMVGSWAGAMGQTQFIPTTFQRFAVDMDGDGRRDLWSSLPDVFASTANHLAEAGWRRGLPWGVEVTLPQGFDYTLADLSMVRPLDEWRATGVLVPRGVAIAGTEPVSVLVPAGAQGPAFVVTRNYRAILQYNNATSYALAVGHLSDRFDGAGPIRAAWPRHERPLSRDERMELQQLLAQRGYAVGEIDGIIGANTRNAFRRWQQETGVPADAFPTASLLERLRAAMPAAGQQPRPAG